MLTSNKQQATRIIRNVGFGFLASFSVMTTANASTNLFSWSGINANQDGSYTLDINNNLLRSSVLNNASGNYVLSFNLSTTNPNNNDFLDIWPSSGILTRLSPTDTGTHRYLFAPNNGRVYATLFYPSFSTTEWTVSNLFLGLVGPSAEETQAALQANVAALQGIYAIQTGTINNSLTYDCSYFDSKGLCLSTGGRYSNASNSHANTTSAMVIGGYRIDEHFRIGGYVDQNLYNTEAGSIASLRSNTPFLGVFGVWNENADQTGFEARLAAAYNNSNMDINRVQVGSSELGYGKTGIDTLSGSATLSYGFKVVPNWIASPYFGVRHTTVSSSGYSEQATADVTAPLTYNGVNQESLSALLGIKASGRLTDQIGLQASAGLEQDMHTYTSAYAATGVDGLTAINFNPNMQKSRAVTSFGATYDLAKGHRLGLNAIWRQESFQNIDTKMAYLTYTMGF